MTARSHQASDIRLPPDSAVHALVVALAGETGTAATGVARYAVVAALRALGWSLVAPVAPRRAVAHTSASGPAALGVVDVQLSRDVHAAVAAYQHAQGIWSRADAVIALVAMGLDAARAAIARRAAGERDRDPVEVAKWRHGISIRIGILHPCYAPTWARAAADGCDPKAVFARALDAWLAANGEMPEAGVTGMTRRPTPSTPGAEILLHIRSAQAVPFQGICARRDLTESAAAVSALAAWVGVAPGIYEIDRTGHGGRGRWTSRVVIAAPVAALGAASAPPRIPAPKPKPTVRASRGPVVGPTRRETPALLAFEAARREVEQTASGPGGFSALMRRAS